MFELFLQAIQVNNQEKHKSMYIFIFTKKNTYIACIYQQFSKKQPQVSPKHLNRRKIQVSEQSVLFRSIYLLQQKYPHRVSKHYRSPAGTAYRWSTRKYNRTTQKTAKNSSFKWHEYTRITEPDSGYISTCIYLTLFRVVAASVRGQTRIKYRTYR